MSTLATKTDLDQLRVELKGDIDKLRVELADTKAEILKWMFGAIGFQTLIIIASVVALIRVVKP